MFDRLKVVGPIRHDRDLSQARFAYLGAVRRLDSALQHFDASDIPMDPGPGRTPLPWTADHVVVLREVAAAVTALLDTRKSWDGLRRSWSPSH
jgi:hypothetical protein